MANTVGPPGDQILNIYRLRTEEIVFFHRARLYPGFPCPSELFERIIQVNRLRLQVHAGRPTKHLSAALTLLQIIDAFQPSTWTEPCYQLPDIPEVPLMAGIHRLAVGLFALMSLESTGLGIMDKVERRKSLLELLAEAWERGNCGDALNWPLAVVGCALADGGSHSDKAFVCRCLEDADKSIFAVAPLVIKAKLQQFWASGMTHWDKCWGELFPVIG